MSDGNAVGRLASRVENAAWELRKAMKAAKDGHRGLTPGDPLEIVNEVLGNGAMDGDRYEVRKLP